MSQILIDYAFSTPHIANSDGSYGFDVPASAIIPSGMTAPIDASGKIYDKALDLGTSISAKVNISSLKIVGTYRFHIRVVFRMDAVFTGTQVMVESDRLPFGIMLIGQAGAVNLSVSLTSSTNGPRTTDIFTTPVVTPGTWHVADLIYDFDTLAAFLDGRVYSIHGFGFENKINLSAAAGASLLIGTGSAAGSHFNGKLAALTFEDSIPASLETLLDLRRTSPQWYITSKVDNLKPKLDMGRPTSPITYNSATSSWTQEYSIGGAIMYNSTAMSAFEIHGVIYQRYKAMPNRDSLGFLISDESVALNAVGRKNLFRFGGIYWSSSTGGWEVLGQMYIDYEDTGESSVWGFPIEAPQSIPGGSSQRMENVTWYLRSGAPKAHEVQGVILTAFLASGGTTVWGFPVSNELPVTVTKGPQKGKNVRLSEFEGCSFYWSAATGAHETHGDIRTLWRSLGGPSSDMGLPTTNELPIPGSSNRMNGFEGGAICWFGSFDSITVVTPFHLYIGTLNTRNKEGPFARGNDLYFHATITQGSTTVFHQRYPSTGSWGDKDVYPAQVTFPLVFTPDPAKPVTFTIDVWDSDSSVDDSPSDDHIGTWIKTLDGSNAWGMREHQGKLQSGSFSLINNIDAAVQPVVNPATLSPKEKWWGFQNKKTDPLTFAQFEEAFSDVSTNTQPWILGDDARALFFQFIDQHIAKDGNCFGMVLEAIYSLKGASLFSLPLNRFGESEWPSVRNEINVKQQYQLGAPALWWFLGQFFSGHTHDPVHVFQASRDAFNSGEHPIICISQNADFSGNPHCVMPIAWNSTTATAWSIDIMDPNFPNVVRSIPIDPIKNTYSYEGIGGTKYSGTASSGGRLQYIPWSVLCTSPRTPVWEAMLVLFGGSFIMFADGATSVSIKDAQGNDIHAHSQRAVDLENKGVRLNGFFTPTPIMNGELPGGFLMSMGVPPAPPTFPPAILQPRASFSPADGIIKKNAALDINQPLTILSDFEAALNESATGDFVHTVRGTKNGGALHYFTKKSFVHFSVTGTLDEKEDIIVTTAAVDTANANFSVQVDRSKKMTIKVTHLLGASTDMATVAIDLETDKAGKINLAAKPSLSILDLELTGAKLKSPGRVSVSAVTNGKTNTQVSALDSGKLEGAFRLKINPSMLGTAGIIIGRLGSGSQKGTVIDSAVLESEQDSSAPTS